VHRFKTVVIGAAVAVLAITAIGAPAAGAVAKGKVAIVQGIPGTKVDICINGKEIKSGLPYGGKKFASLNASQKLLKVYKKNYRTCGGTLLAKKRFDLLPAADLTIVVTRKKPRKVMIFDNSGLGFQPSPVVDTAAAWRYAGNLGTVDFVITYEGITLNNWHPADHVLWTKGDEYQYVIALGGDGNNIMMLYVTEPFTEHVFVGPYFTHVTPGYRYEWIVVGTNDRNARVVRIKRAVIY